MGGSPLLYNRDFRLVWSGEMVSELGSQASTVAYPLLVLALTGSAAKAGVVGLVKWLPLSIFSLPAGALADRVDRKRLMIASDAVRLLAAASIVAALSLGGPAYPQILAVAFVDGAMFVTSLVCERGALGQVVPAEQLEDAVARNEARSFTAGIVGPPLGGALFAAARALPFLADVVSFACSATALSFTRSPFQAPVPDPRLTARSTVRGIGEGFRWLSTRPFFRATALLFALGNPVFTGLYLLAILLAKHDGASSTAVGGMLAIAGAGGVLGAIAAGRARRRLTSRTVIVAQESVLAVMIFTLLAVHGAFAIGVVVAAAEFGTPITNSVVTGARIAAVPDRLQGRVAAVTALLSSSLSWLGPLAVGIAFQTAGATTTVLLVGAWATALATAAIRAPGLRQGPTARAPVLGRSHPADQALRQ